MSRFGKLNTTVIIMAVLWLIAVHGIITGWWDRWWQASSDFRLPVLLIAAATSLVAGVAAATTYEWLRERNEHRRWRAAEYVGAAQLTGSALAVAQGVAGVIREAGGSVPDVVESLEDIERVRDAFLSDANLVEHRGIALSFARFSQRAWRIVGSMPGLRDDPDLVKETAQASDIVPRWAATLDRLAAGGIPAERAHRAVATVDLCVKVGWQVVWASYDFGERHLDPEIEAESFLQYREHELKIAEAIRSMQDAGELPLEPGAGEDTSSPLNAS